MDALHRRLLLLHAADAQKFSGRFVFPDHRRVRQALEHQMGPLVHAGLQDAGILSLPADLLRIDHQKLRRVRVVFSFSVRFRRRIAVHVPSGIHRPLPDQTGQFAVRPADADHPVSCHRSGTRQSFRSFCFRVLPGMLRGQKDTRSGRIGGSVLHTVVDRIVVPRVLQIVDEHTQKEYDTHYDTD